MAFPGIILSMDAKDMHSRGTHTLIGVGAVLAGVALGFTVVYFDTARDTGIVANAQGQCKQQEDTCVANKTPYQQCHQKWTQCIMSKCSIGGTGAGQCNKDPDCQDACTESSSGVAGKISCCKGEPKHNNPCKDEVDGKCNPMMPMMGGMPPMLPMPMPMPDMPMPPQDGCDPFRKDDAHASTTATSTRPNIEFPCPSSSQSGVGGLLNSWFGADTYTSGSGNYLQNTARSAADKLWSFITGDDTNESTQTSGSQNSASTQTNAAANSPFSASGANNSAQLNAQSGGTQNTASQGSSFLASQVTGFSAELSTQDAVSSESSGSSSVLTTIGEMLRGIEALLRNMLSSLFSTDVPSQQDTDASSGILFSIARMLDVMGAILKNMFSSLVF